MCKDPPIQQETDGEGKDVAILDPSYVLVAMFSGTPTWKTAWQLLKVLNGVTRHRASPLPPTDPRETSMSVSTAALFPTDKGSNSLKPITC